MISYAEYIAARAIVKEYESQGPYLGETNHYIIIKRGEKEIAVWGDDKQDCEKKIKDKYPDWVIVK